MKEAYCPECNRRLKVGAHPYLDQRLRCSGCETNLVVVSLRPLELDVDLLNRRTKKTNKRPHTVEIPCPECENGIKLNSHAHLGQQLRCPACYTTLEVVSTDPLDLDVALTAGWRSGFETPDKRQSQRPRRPDQS